MEISYQCINEEWKAHLVQRKFDLIKSLLEQELGVINNLRTRATQVMLLLFSVYGTEVSDDILEYFYYFDCIPNYAVCNEHLFFQLNIFLQTTGIKKSAVILNRTLLELALHYQDVKIFRFLIEQGVTLIDVGTGSPRLLIEAMCSCDDIAVQAIRLFVFSSQTFVELLTRTWDDAIQHCAERSISGLREKVSPEKKRVMLTIPKVNALLLSGFPYRRYLYFNCNDIETFSHCVSKFIVQKADISFDYYDLLYNYVALRNYAIVEYIMTLFRDIKAPSTEYLMLLRTCIEDKSSEADSAMCNFYERCKKLDVAQILLPPKNETPLQIAVLCGSDVGKIKLLLSLGEDPNYYTNSYLSFGNNCPMRLASERKQDEICTLFTEELEKQKKKKEENKK